MSGTDDEIVVAITAQTAQLQEGVAQAAASVQGLQAQVTTAAQQFNASITSQGEALMRLDAAFKGNIASAKGLAEAESALDQAMATGAITAEAQAAYLEQLNAAEGIAAVNARVATEAIVEQNAALTISGGVAREVGVLVGELARGNYTRLEGSTITLANRTGLLQAAFSPLGLAVMGLAGAAIFLISQFVKAEEATNEFNRVLAETGGIAGVTAGQLQGIADRVGAFSGNIRTADEIVTKLAATGRFTGDALEAAAQGASNAMQLTGESAQQAAAQMEKLGKDPVAGIVELNDHFHFLTADVFDHIQALQRAGDQYGALQVAAEAFANGTSDRLDNLNQKMGFFERQINDIKVGYATIDEGLRKAFDPTLQEESAKATKRYLDIQYQLNQALKEGNQRPYEAQYIQGLEQEAAKAKDVAVALRDKVLAEQKDAEVQGKKAQSNAVLVREVAEQDKFNQHLKETSLLQEKIAEEKARVEAIHAGDPNSDSIKGIQFDTSGAVAGGEQWTAILTKLQKEFGETKQHAVSMHKELTQELQEDEAADKVSFDNRKAYELQFWQGKLNTLRQGSIEYAQAYIQVQTLQHEVDQKRVEDAKKAEQEVASAYKSETEIAIKSVTDIYSAREKAAQSQLQLGQITIAQETALMRQYAQQEYDIELGILEHYRSLMAGKPNVVQTINGQIEALEQKHAATMAQISEQSAKREQQLWNQRLKPITQAFNQSITGMIQGTQTLQQGVQRALQSILLSYVRLGVESLQQWVSGEFAKTSATMDGVTQRSAIQQSGITQGMAADALMNQKQIANAAYTGAAKAYQAMAGIPIIGPALGVAAAAATFIGIEAYDNIASASGGWDRVPYDDAPALLHRNEMVLPANLADRVRGMTDGGGEASGGDTHYHTWNIQAMDGRSFEQFLRRGGMNTLGKVASSATKNSAVTRM